MTITVTIERLGHQGDGIAPGPVYVARTLPGEVVSGEPDGGRLTGFRIDKPSDQRVRPPCRHYNSCGGCQLQHASDGFVADWKQDVARRALSAQGLDAPLRPILVSPQRSRRRAGFAARRTKKGALAGFHGPASAAIAEIPDCRLLEPALLACIPAVQALAVCGASRKTALTVMATLSQTGPDLSVTGGKAADGPLRAALAALAGTHGLARLTWNGEVIAQSDPPFQVFGDAKVVPPPGAFLQATREGESALVAAVQEAVTGAGRVADLFCGCGTFSLPLALTSMVHAVESDADMIAAMDSGWRGAAGLKQVTSEVRDLFRRPMLHDELAPFDAVVLDPPRAGAEAQTRELARAMVPAIAYVSCNPVSFARDAAVLVAAGYGLDWVQVVDQFRWSTHTELVAAFSKPGCR